MQNRPIIFLLGLVVLMSACSSSHELASEPEFPEVLPEPIYGLVSDPEIEDFDSSPYVEPPLDSLTRTIVHDVPAALLEGHADRGLQEMVPGFRVQIYASLDKQEAIEMEEVVKAWLKAGGQDPEPQERGQAGERGQDPEQDGDRNSEQERGLEQDRDAGMEEPDSLTEELPVYVEYIQPYYRVRLGNFTSHEEALRARSRLAQDFPEAFVVQGRVVVTR